MDKASYFIMVEKLLDGQPVDYEKYIRRIDPMVPRAFLRSISSRITVKDGRVPSIEFKNGSTHAFAYKWQNTPGLTFEVGGCIMHSYSPFSDDYTGSS